MKNSYYERRDNALAVLDLQELIDPVKAYGSEDVKFLITRLSVPATIRNLGCATRLLTTCCADADAELKTLHLEFVPYTGTDSQRLLSLYTKFGFKETEATGLFRRDPVDVRYVEKFVLSKAWPLHYKAIVELMDKGYLGPEYTGVSHLSQGFVAYNKNNAVVGFISFEKEDWNNSFAIGLAYVVPECRRQGIHSKLLSALKDRMKDMKINFISSGTRYSNTEARAAFQAQGREPTYVYYRLYNPLMKDTQ